MAQTAHTAEQHSHNHTSEARVVRAPHLALSWRGDRLALTNGLTGDVYTGSVGLAALLTRASQPFTRAELAERAGVQPAVVDDLLRAGLLVTEAEAHGTERWSTFELVVQRMAGGGGIRDAFDWRGMPPMRKGAWGLSVTPLQEVAPLPDVSLGDVLEERRTHCGAGGQAIGQATLGSLLVHSARIQEFKPAYGSTRRPHFSFYGRHPLEIYPVVLRAGDLASGAYWFDAFEPSLHELDVDRDMLPRLPGLIADSLGADGHFHAAVVLLVTAVFERTLWAYRDCALTLVYREAGALLQTLHLVTTALGLIGRPIPLRGEMTFARWLGLEPERESLVGCFAVGAMS